MADNWSKFSGSMFRTLQMMNQGTRYRGFRAGPTGFHAYSGNLFAKEERMKKKEKDVSGGKKKKNKKKQEKSGKEKLNKEKLLDWEQGRMVNLEPDDDQMPEACEDRSEKKTKAGMGRSEKKPKLSAGISEVSGKVPAAEQPLNLQQAVLWSEILGEPVSMRRRKKRMNQFNGNQVNAYRR